MSQHTGSTVRAIRDSDVAEMIDRRELRAANTLDMSVGYRLGVSGNYQYGQSRPELRPLVTD